MTPAEILAAIDARAAGDAEFAGHVAARRDAQIAAALSEGRTKLVPTEIGSGAILAALGEGGGAFLDALVEIGTVNRNVYWTMDLIRQGRLRIDLPATRAGMQGLAAAVPSLAPAVQALMTIGVEPDPIPAELVTSALDHRDTPEPEAPVVAVNAFVRVLAPFDSAYPATYRVIASSGDVVHLEGVDPAFAPQFLEVV